MELLSTINILPNELKDQILEYLPLRYVVFLNKTNYFAYHQFIKYWIPADNYDNYIRSIIRNDSYFCLNQLIKENNKVWIKPKKYEYNKVIYSSYCNLLNYYCIQFQSPKCREIINSYLSKKDGIGKNQHKNNSYIHIRWKT